MGRSIPDGTPGDDDGPGQQLLGREGHGQDVVDPEVERPQLRLEVATPGEPQDRRDALRQAVGGTHALEQRRAVVVVHVDDGQVRLPLGKDRLRLRESAHRPDHEQAVVECQLDEAHDQRPVMKHECAARFLCLDLHVLTVIAHPDRGPCRPAGRGSYVPMVRPMKRRAVSSPSWILAWTDTHAADAVAGPRFDRARSTMSRSTPDGWVMVGSTGGHDVPSGGVGTPNGSAGAAWTSARRHLVAARGGGGDRRAGGAAVGIRRLRAGSRPSARSRAASRPRCGPRSTGRLDPAGILVRMGRTLRSRLHRTAEPSSR